MGFPFNNTSTLQRPDPLGFPTYILHPKEGVYPEAVHVRTVPLEMSQLAAYKASYS